MSSGAHWVGGAAVGLVNYVDLSELRGVFSLEAFEEGWRAMDAPFWMPAGSCVRYEGQGCQFAAQSRVIRGRA